MHQNAIRIFMYYVYLLRSTPNPEQTYVGFTEDLKARLTAHNHGQSPHTAKFKPWELITYLAFKDKSTALAFEKYLKSHSGKAFANKRLW
jgi:putative endonuclease